MSIKSWNNQSIVNDIQAGTQRDSEVAILDDGSYVIVWEDLSVTPFSIGYQLYTAAGNPVGDNQFLTPSTSMSADFNFQDPTVVGTANGGFAIAFEGTNAGSTLFSTEVRFYDATGLQLSAAPIATDRDESAQELNLFRVEDDVHLTGRFKDANDDPFLLIFDSENSNSFVDASLLGGTAEIETDMMGAKLVGRDIAVIAYENETTGEVEFTLFDTNTNTASAPVTVTAPGTSYPEPKVTPLANGAFVVSYITLDRPFPQDSYDVAFQIFDFAGNQLLDETFANSTTRFSQHDHDTVALPDGGFMVIWEDETAMVIYGRTFGPDGSPNGGQTVIATGDFNTVNDSLDAEAMQDGRVVVTWTANVSGTHEVFTKIIDPRDGVVTGRIDDSGETVLDDLLLGSFDNDAMMGLAGDDTLYGLEDNDLIMGNSGDDVLYGGDGNDKLYGGDDDDLLYGDAGDDLLDGGSGINELRGGTGDDRYLVSTDTDVVYESSNEGSDAVFASVSYTLTGGSSVELLRTLSNGSIGNVDLTGNALAQTIVGNAGNNSLNGTNGEADVFRGLGGDDTYRVYSTDDQVFEAVGGGSDRVRTSVDFELMAGQEIEFLTTNQFSGTDPLELEGNEFSQTIIGNAGENLLIDGLGAADTLNGGAGDDRFRVFSTGTEIIEQSFGGDDRVFSSADFVLNEGARLEFISTSSFRGTDSISLTGNEFAQRVVGNAGDNRLSGMGGSDTLRGSDGNDVFVFESEPVDGQRDVIADFNPGEDQFEIDSDVFTGLSAGELPGFAFRANTTGLALDLNDRIMYNTNSGELFYDADGSGGGASIQIAILESGLAITAGDFDIL